MTGPLIILAIPAMLIGFWGSQLFNNGFQHFLEGGAYRDVQPNLLLAGVGAVLAIAGIGTAWMMYGARQFVAEPLARFGSAYALLARRYYIDEFYMWLIDKLVIGVGYALTSFDREAQYGTGIASLGGIAFILLSVGFAVKVPIFPFHTWLPDAHVEAPTAGSVMLAGVLLKMGGYGLLRLCVRLLPQAAHDWQRLLIILAVINRIYGALVELAQTDLKKMIANSSISHMGYVILGIAPTSTAANSKVVPWATVIVRAPLGLSGPHGQDRLSPIEGLNPALFIGARHQGPLGWVQIEADDVAHLLDQLRIVGQLEGLSTVGCRPNARQMRWTVGRLRPVAGAMERVLQCVASRGVDSSVFTTTTST